MRVRRQAAALAEVAARVAASSGGGGAPAQPQPDPVNVVLQISAETGLIDESSYGHSLVPGGNTARTTSSPLSGSASIAFDGVGDYIDIPIHSSLWLGDSSFVLEVMVQSSQVNAYRALISYQSMSVNLGWTLFTHDSNGTVRFQAYNTSGGLLVSLVPPPETSMNDGLPHHVAVERDGSAWTLFIDGAVVATATASGEIRVPSGTEVIRIAQNDLGFPGFGGKLDNIRLSREAFLGGAAYTPSSTFPTSTTSNAYVEDGFVDDYYI